MKKQKTLKETLSNAEAFEIVEAIGTSKKMQDVIRIAKNKLYAEGKQGLPIVPTL
jgi:hypothetical protein